MWLNLQEAADLVTFIEEILNGKLHFLCIARFYFLRFQFYFLQTGFECTGAMLENPLTFYAFALNHGFRNIMVLIFSQCRTIWVNKIHRIITTPIFWGLFLGFASFFKFYFSCCLWNKFAILYSLDVIYFVLKNVKVRYIISECVLDCLS